MWTSWSTCSECCGHWKSIRTRSCLSYDCKEHLKEEKTIFSCKETSITVYHGLIIDGIAVDGRLFGRQGGVPTTITLDDDEFVIKLGFGYNPTRWYEADDWDGYPCNLMIHTNKRAYGPWSTEECDDSSEVTIMPNTPWIVTSPTTAFFDPSKESASSLELFLRYKSNNEGGRTFYIAK